MAKRGREQAGGAAKRACKEATFELASLLSSLPPLVAKRGRAGAEWPLDPGKRQRRWEENPLETRLEALIIKNMLSREEEIPTKERLWSSFPTDMLELISSLLPLPDVPRFGAVCKHWNSSIFPVYKADASPVLMNIVQTGTGSISCYSPYFNKIFVLDTPSKVLNGRICSARDGWFTLDWGNEIVLANPVSGSLIGLEFVQFGPGYCASWGHPPNTCKFFGVYCYHGNTRVLTWDAKSSTRISYPNEVDFTSLCCNPVLHNGLFYCLGKEGVLVSFNPLGRERTVLAKLGVSGFSYRHAYLVESEGELLAVLTGGEGAVPIYVLRFNEMEMRWERMETLGGRALFTGTAASFSLARPPRRMANKIYLPRFHGEPETIQAEVRNVDGHLFFVPKGLHSYLMNGEDGRNSGCGAWCYDLESGMDRELMGSTNPLQHQNIWVDFGSGNESNRYVSDSYDCFVRKRDIL